MADTRISIGVIALVIYEYLVTFGTEVQLFWGREVTGASVLFFVNRYMRLFYVLSALRSYRSPFITTTLVCASYEYTLKILGFLDYIPWAGNYILRSHPILTSLYWFTTVNDPVYGCLQDLNLPPALYTSRVSLIAADLIVIIVTWITTYKTALASRSVLNDNQPTFSGLLLRDGTIYFMVMLTMNVLQLAFSTSPRLDESYRGQLEPAGAYLWCDSIEWSGPLESHWS
ncbi:hypothetical protein V8D89_004892 [Ganoderma adspersum]